MKTNLESQECFLILGSEEREEKNDPGRISVGFIRRTVPKAVGWTR